MVATNGLPDYLLLDVELRRVGEEAYLTARCSPAAVLANLTSVGEHRIGLAPGLEVALADDLSMRDLVSDDSPWFFYVDHRFLVFEHIQETATRLPVAPGLTNHITLDLRNLTERGLASGSQLAGSLGWGLGTVLPILGCAFLSTSTSASIPITDIRLSDLAVAQDTYLPLSPTSWDLAAPPDLLRVKFAFFGSSVPREPGDYCVKVVLNGQLRDYECQEGDPLVELYSLPPAIYSKVARPCGVAAELADFPSLDRNFASQIALVNGRV